jgi:hypothetical protein
MFEVSRFGEKPKPTVIVRMKENGTLDRRCKSGFGCLLWLPDDRFRVP